LTFQAVCRAGDKVTGICKNHKNPVNFNGIWDNHPGNVTAEGLQIIKQGDLGSTDCGHKFTADGGSTGVLAYGLKLQRVGDPVTVQDAGNGGTSITGSPGVVSN
jgi:hypothetical protein